MPLVLCMHKVCMYVQYLHAASYLAVCIQCNNYLQQALSLLIIDKERFYSLLTDQFVRTQLEIDRS